MSEAEIRAQESKRQQLSLLVGDAVDESETKFEANVNDSRFTKAFKNKEFALDTTHKDFHKIEKGNFVKK